FESPRARHYLCLRPRKQKSNHPRSLFCSMNHGEESPVCASVLRTRLLPWASEPIQTSVASVRIVTISKPAIAHIYPIRTFSVYLNELCGEASNDLSAYAHPSVKSPIATADRSVISEMI